MQKLLIVRGIPGSGKSTYAKTLMPEYEHIEADMFHIDQNNVYNWKFENVSRAHDWCFGATVRALLRGKSVVVSNTFIRAWEFKDYTDIASSLSIPYEIKTMKGEYKSTHNVPDAVIERMKLTFETFTGA